MIESDFYDKFPFREGRAAYLTRIHGDMWNLRKFDYPSYSNKSKCCPYLLAHRIIHRNIGKSFNKSFSYYCKIVKIYHQRIFLDYFNPKRNWRSEEYWIDENGLINYKPWRWKRKQKITYKSDDYKTELRHKVTGKLKPIYIWLYKNKYKEEDFIPFIIQGYELEFQSKKDRLYIRLRREQNKRRKLQHKQAQKLRKLVDEEKFRNLLNAKKKKDKETERQILERKGFDPIKSFRNL